MKLLTASALAALLVGSIGLADLVPANAAPATSDTTTAAPAAPGPMGQRMRPGNQRFGPRMGMGMMRHHTGPMGGLADPGTALLAMGCGDRGAEALEIALVRLQYGVKPTTDQQPLFDALKTAALASQKTLSDACTAARPADAAAAAKTTLPDRLQARLAVSTARVAALNEVLPKFKAFYDSLTDQQKQKLEPQARRAGNNRPGFHARPWVPGGMGPMHRPGAMAPATPAPVTPAPAPDATAAPAT
jgi:hypothetical protein